jgi:tRNA-binding protein
MEDELEILIQRSDHELPPASDTSDAPPGQKLEPHELTRDGGMRIPPNLLDQSVLQLWFELPANGFDLGKLRHGIRLLAMTTNREDLPYAPSSLGRKPDVGADEFFALDIRTGRVVDVWDFPEARKPAWKVRVDFGPVIGELQSSAQIRNYSKEELMGRLVVGAVNLGSKRIAGFKSEFLILGALEADGTVRLLQLEDGVEPGAPVA